MYYKCCLLIILVFASVVFNTLPLETIQCKMSNVNDVLPTQVADRLKITYLNKYLDVILYLGPSFPNLLDNIVAVLWEYCLISRTF